MKADNNGLDGQMNLFDVFSRETEEKTAVKDRKAKKDETAEKEPEEEKRDFYPIHRKAEQMQVVMHRIFEDMLEKEKIVVAYLDYNVIYYKEKREKPQLLQFANAKLAVDYYMEIVERLRNDEMLIEDEGELMLADV